MKLLRILLIRTVILSTYLLLKIIPVRFHEYIAVGLGTSIFKISKKYSNLMLSNLHIAFKDKYSKQELEEISIRSYQNLCRSVAEFIRFPQLSKEDILQMVKLEGEEILKKELEKGKGAILVSAHFGNWEMLAIRLSVVGYPLTAIGRDQNDSIVNDIIAKFRAGFGTKVIPRGVPVYERIITLLKNNELIALVADQNAGTNGIFVDFFGKKASSFKGPGLFAVKADAPIVPIFILREGFNKHKAVILEPIKIKATGNPQQDVYLYTEAYTKVIEQMVAAYPDHWLWLHKRWKTPPPEEKH